MGRPREIQPKPERVNTAIRFPVALLGRLRVEAVKQRVSVNWLVTKYCEDGLDGI